MNKQQWIERAKDLGIEGLEITQTTSRSREVNWFEGQMDSFVTSRILSTSLRALVDGKIVSTSLEKVEDEKMDEVLNQLIQAAKEVSETEKDIFVGPMETEEVQSTKHWVEPDADQIKTILASIEKKLLAADERIKMVNQAAFESTTMVSELTNSLGVNVHDQTGTQVIGAVITMVDGDDLRDGYLVKIVENLDDFDEDTFVAELVEKVTSHLHAKSVSSRLCPVIFNNETMSTLFGCFAGMFKGSLIAKGISPLTDKLHQQIFSDKITIVDDPRNQDALFLQNYDDEGFPTSTKTVVDHGVFETILHNTKSALKMGTQSTGNGFKSGAGATDVSPMNLYIEPGKDSFEQLVEKMGNGVIITDLGGMHAGVDFVSTNFSLQAQGYLVENGKKVRPLTLITVAGNFIDLMKNQVEAVGSDLKWETRNVCAPSILFKEVSIGGNE